MVASTDVWGSVASAVTGRHVAIKYNVAIDIVTCAYFLAGASAVDIAQQIAAKVVRQWAMRRLSRGQ